MPMAWTDSSLGGGGEKERLPADAPPTWLPGPSCSPYGRVELPQQNRVRAVKNQLRPLRGQSVVWASARAKRGLTLRAHLARGVHELPVTWVCRWKSETESLHDTTDLEK